LSNNQAFEVGNMNLPYTGSNVKYWTFVRARLGLHACPAPVARSKCNNCSGLSC
jgi:hypothetical protein